MLESCTNCPISPTSTVLPISSRVVKRAGQVGPAARADEPLARRRRLDGVEAILLDLEERQDAGMHARAQRICLPGFEVGLDVDLAHAVERDDVEFARRLVVLGRVAGAHDDPVVGHAMAPERLELQELQHRRVQRLGHAVDLVEEQDAALQPGPLHVVVDARDDLAHGVLGGLVGQRAVGAVDDEWQSERRLARVVRHRVRDQADAQLVGNLAHDGRLADARGPYEEQGALRCGLDAVHSHLVDGKVCLDGVFHLLLCVCDVHNCLVSSLLVPYRY